MKESSLPNRRGDGEEEMWRIRGWLEQLTIEEADGEIEHREDKTGPVTPPRRLKLREPHEEVSPTDTSFSGGSIFDIPEHYHEPSSPCPLGRFRDDISEATSHDDEEEIEFKDENIAKATLAQPNFTSPLFRPSSLESHHPPSDHDVEGPLTSDSFSESSPHDINIPRIVHLVSCLQCTLADLPCSRTTPSCTRCNRNGNPTTCLLLRRRFYEEIDESSVGACTLPVLLKLKGEELGAWREKMAVAREVEREWQDRQDKRNWVLPRQDIERRGDWRMRGCVGRKIHPGEGVGRVAYEELILDADVECVF